MTLLILCDWNMLYFWSSQADSEISMVNHLMDVWIGHHHLRLHVHKCLLSSVNSATFHSEQVGNLIGDLTLFSLQLICTLLPSTVHHTYPGC